MSYRSSIFSFSTLAGSPRPTRAFLLALLVVLAARAGLGLAGDRMLAVPGQTADRRFFAIEDRIRHFKLRPRVLLMGSSFSYYGLHAPTFAETAGMPAGDVANLAVNGGTSFEARKLLERNPQVTDRAKLLVIDLTRSQLNDRNEVRPLFYRLADVRDRLALDRRADRDKAMIDFALLNLREKRSVDLWLQGAYNIATSRSLVPKSPLPTRPLWAITAAERARKLHRFSPAVAAKRQLEHFVKSRMAQSFVQRFLKLCADRKIRVVVLCTPKLNEYHAAIPEIPGATDANKAYFRWLDSLKGQAEIIVYDTSQSAGLTDRDFMDYGHLTEHGAKQLTRTLVHDLTARGLLPLK